MAESGGFGSGADGDEAGVAGAGSGGDDWAWVGPDAEDDEELPVPSAIGFEAGLTQR